MLSFIFLLILTGSGSGFNTAKPEPDPSKRPPCLEKTESNQFNFWLGEWDVTSNGEKVATSKISAVEANCIILEQYSQDDGYTGQSFNFYDPILGKWRQVWVDLAGNISEFRGEYKGHAMYFEGTTYSSGGTKVRRKMTLFNLGTDKVRQLSERSTDEGKSWNINYDFIYLRKK